MLTLLFGSDRVFIYGVEVEFSTRFPKIEFTPNYNVEDSTSRNSKVLFTPKYGAIEILKY